MNEITKCGLMVLLSGSICFFILFVLLLTGCSWSLIPKMFKDYPSDNIIENCIEDVIAIETGQKIDLSPFSPEKPDRWDNFPKK